MSETGAFTSRVAAVLRRRETLRIAAPAGAAVVIVGVLLGVFLSGGSDPDGSSEQSADIADRTAAETVGETVSPAEEETPDTADAGVSTPAVPATEEATEAATETADAGAATPAPTEPEEMAEAPPVPADIPGGDIGAGTEEEAAEPAPAVLEKPADDDDLVLADATPTPADPPAADCRRAGGSGRRAGSHGRGLKRLPTMSSSLPKTPLPSRMWRRTTGRPLMRKTKRLRRA